LNTELVPVIDVVIDVGRLLRESHSRQRQAVPSKLAVTARDPSRLNRAVLI